MNRKTEYGLWCFDQPRGNFDRRNSGLSDAYSALVASLKSLVVVMNDRNAVGTNVDGRWMGVPNWEQVDRATALLRKLGEIE